MTTQQIMSHVDDELADQATDADRIRFLRTCVHRLLENHADLARKLEDANGIDGYAGYAADQAEDAIRCARPPVEDRTHNAIIQGIYRRAEERAAKQMVEGR